MNIDYDLSSLSYFVMGGDAESVSVLEDCDSGDYEWLLYIMPGNYDRDLGHRSRGYINTGVFEYLFSHRDTSFDFYGKTAAPVPNITSCVSYRAGLDTRVNDTISRSSHPDCIEFTHDDVFLLTPFLGVGSRIPTRLGSKVIAGLLAVCSSPSNTHCVLVGDTQAAKSVLGVGLHLVRGMLIEYLGATPGESSAPPDMALPLIYSEYASTPRMVDIASNQVPYRPGGAANYSLFTVLYLSSLLYCLLESDHEYRGLEVTGELPGMFPEGWCIRTNSSTTQVPFRYPLLVLLLAAFSRRVEVPDDSVVPLSLTQNTLTTTGSDGTLSQLATVLNYSSTNCPLFNDLPSICRSFFVQLYRITCKGALRLPSGREYPRRSEASRAFIEEFNAYSNCSGLASYLSLADALVQVSASQRTCSSLASAAKLLGYSAYDIVQNPKLVNPLKVTRVPNTEELFILSWKTHCARSSAWANLVISIDDGVSLPLCDYLAEMNISILDSINTRCSREEMYTIVNQRSVDDITNYYGFMNSSISIQKIVEEMLPRISFNAPELRKISMLDVVKYYEDTRHGGLEKLIKTTAKMLSSYSLGELVGEYSTSKFAETSARLAVKQYLESVLDTRRV